MIPLSEQFDNQGAWEDPIVKEVRAAREALLVQLGHDLGALGRYLKDEQRTSGHEVVSLPARAAKGRSGEAA
jgi:hypothetical protein